ncbi:MAG: hypothetical protein GY844_11595 [Bradyrhizobium sp.]|uniref:DUF2946 domain-containing protein n=1 Tax=Afipia broomeae ATCC 49717 TaxID=883078 RepID=K8P4C8_9BRAD|nr:hypothetical protein [Afipia broomeae]EKS34535.1 hypothetical protein HMPREF9695_04445 [Afipia broomeae ATCC 49717]MCP4617068.1 hypothetical protein [Bradyrhizobium sp.]
MDIQIGQKKPRGKARRIRRGFLMFLAATYLFVCFGQTISCADEVLADITIATAMDKADTQDGDGSQAPVLVKHCPMCAPMVAPVSASVLQPDSAVSRLAFAPPSFHLGSHGHLDPPPPKSLT